MYKKHVSGAMIMEKAYISSMDKQLQHKLDDLIDKYAVYSSDTTYGDIIIRRHTVFDFIHVLTNLGIVINSIGWWCNATDENKNKYGCPHGYGGPMTKAGWFSEMVHEFDEIREIHHDLFLSLDTDFKMDTVKIINDKTIELILNKRTVTCADGTFLTFRNNPCLTPGLALYVPDDWKPKMNDAARWIN